MQTGMHLQYATALQIVEPRLEGPHPRVRSSSLGDVLVGADHQQISHGFSPLACPQRGSAARLSGMQTVISKDGTPIASERAGTGQPVVFAAGAFNDHTTCAGLADALADTYTVVTYDRRGRGASGDTRPYAIEREIEDLAALLEAVGGSAAVFGYSSGGMLALQAAVDGLP